ncbi:hypothetical protein VK98_20185 [Chromobacterium sp. LK11]|nr:hypothetical protein VK98_20185 [Chromobacterium sp. LK11]
MEQPGDIRGSARFGLAIGFLVLIGAVEEQRNSHALGAGGRGIDRPALGGGLAAAVFLVAEVPLLQLLIVQPLWIIERQQAVLRKGGCTDLNGFGGGSLLYLGHVFGSLIW